jgi:dinuclear metal center YbgI/SA1388 family protein
MIVKDIIKILDEKYPFCYAEDYDNVGLIVGDDQSKVKGIVVCLDTIESVVDEAIQKKCNVIVSFHPIIFEGLKRLTNKSHVEIVVNKCIKNNISIIAIHTAMDNSIVGVNKIICDKLELEDIKILVPKKGTIKKLTTYLPHKNLESIKTKLFKSGAGTIGNYDECSFYVKGIGTFKGNESSNPMIGNKGIQTEIEEVKISFTFPMHKEKEILNILKENHPYDEYAYEIISLENINQNIGLGMIGKLNKSISEENFITYLKDKMNTKLVRHSEFTGKKIRTVAVLGGSGSFAINNAIAAKADAYITSDLKYHDFFKGEKKILLTDIGHYESEQYTKNVIHTHLTEKITNFAIVLTETNSNPVKYS